MSKVGQCIVVLSEFEIKYSPQHVSAVFELIQLNRTPRGIEAGLAHFYCPLLLRVKGGLPTEICLYHPGENTVRVKVESLLRRHHRSITHRRVSGSIGCVRLERSAHCKIISAEIGGAETARACDY